jgi:hypothetical protein
MSSHQGSFFHRDNDLTIFLNVGKMAGCTTVASDPAEIGDTTLEVKTAPWRMDKEACFALA